MPVKQLSDGNPDGTVLGQSASDLISFYNVSAGRPALRLRAGGRPYGSADEFHPLWLQPGPGAGDHHASE